MADTRLEQMDRTIKQIEQQPTAAETNGPAGQPAVPIKPELRGIDLLNRAVITSVGTAELSDIEAATISRIAVRAFRRMLSGIVAQIGERPAAAPKTARRGRPPAKKRGRPKAKAAVSPTGKRRGRPPKIKPAPIEAVGQPAQAGSAQQELPF